MTQPTPPTEWAEIGQRLINHCPSATYRATAAKLLATVSELGPLGEAEEEFRKVYKFLHYNEPARVLRVAEELVRGRLRRKHHSLHVRNNAWKYVVSAFDAWIGRARIFYLAAGIVEGSLKSRLDERLTDVFGENWQGLPDVVPSSVLEQSSAAQATQQLSASIRVLEEWSSPSSSVEEADGLIRQLQEILLTKPVTTTREEPPSRTGAEFTSELTFSQLRSFFQTKRLWAGRVDLQSIFKPQVGETAVLRADVDKVLDAIHKMRNEVAHYRPSGHLSFAEALFAVARLAKWLDVDLQWVYGSIDTRLSTELSHLLESRYQGTFNRALEKSAACIGSSCKIGEPLDLMLREAPTRWPAEGITDGITLACLYHRVQTRAVLHHTSWP